MKNSFILYGLLVVLILGICIGFPIGRCSNVCAPCPDIKPGIVTIRDTVRIPAPEVAVVPAPKIKKKAKPVQQYISTRDEETGTTIIESVSDTENCYEAEKTFSDSGRVVVLVCSRTFTAEPPADLSMKIDYQPPPIRETERIRVDTTIQPQRPRFWREFKIAGVSVIVGAAIGAGTLFILGR